MFVKLYACVLGHFSVFLFSVPFLSLSLFPYKAMRAKGLNGLISESTGRIRGNTGSFIQRISSSSSKASL